MPRRVIHSLKGHFGPPKEEFNSDEIDPPPDYESKDILHILDRIRYNNITTSTTSEIPEQIIHVGQQELQLQLHGPTSDGIENNIKMPNAVAVQQAQNPPFSLLSQQQASTFSMTSGATINTVEQNKLFMEEIVHSTVLYVWFLILLALVGFVIFNYMWNREKKKKKKSLVSRKSSSPV